MVKRIVVNRESDIVERFRILRRVSEGQKFEITNAGEKERTDSHETLILARFNPTTRPDPPSTGTILPMVILIRRPCLLQ